MSMGSKQFFLATDCTIWIHSTVLEGKVPSYISYKVHAFWFIDLIKKRRLKICREACRQFQIHAFCCIDLIFKKKWKCRQFQILSSIPGLCFRQCHSQDSWGTVSIDILSLSFWFFWVLLTVPYSTFLLTVIYQ